MAMSVAEADRRLTGPGEMFEVEEVDIRGGRYRVWKHAPPTLGAILADSTKHGDATWLVYEDERMTFTEHFRAAAHLAGVLRNRFGVVPGDRVAIAMRNYPEWSVTFWAAAAAGAVVVPLNAWWTGAELHYGLADCGAKVLVCDAKREEVLSGHWDGLPDLQAVIVARGAPGPGHLDLSEVLGAVPDDVALPELHVDTDDDATIFYTSGTTGRPKGALGTHRNICHTPMSLMYVTYRNATRAGVDPGGGGDGSRAMLLSVPLFHATGCHSILVLNLLIGGKLVMMDRWDAGRALELIERERVTNFGGVPTMVLQVLDHPDFDRRDTSSVRGVSYGGAPAPADLVRRIGRHFPASHPANGYGLTETSSVSTMNQGGDYTARPDSVGPPLPIVDVKVVDPAGATLPAGAIGELWVRGPNVVKGYWGRPDDTASAITDGWLHTGDLARIDDVAFVSIVDRAKDMLIRGGENVYCVEIEGALFEHPAVAEAAVVGVPHDVLGEEVGAVVRLQPGAAADPADLRAWVGERLAAFKVPAHLWFVDEPLPRNPAGKVMKRELRERFAPR